MTECCWNGHGNMSYRKCSCRTAADKPDKEQYCLNIVNTQTLSIKVTLNTNLPSEAKPGKEWIGCLLVNDKIAEHWYGSTCADIASYAENIIKKMHSDITVALGVA